MYNLVRLFGSGAIYNIRPHTNKILPWIIQQNIKDTDDIRYLFFLGGEENTLPVKITIGDADTSQTFTHELTYETTCGILAFAHPDMYNAKITVSMFDQVIGKDYVIDKHAAVGTPFMFSDGANYSIDIGDITLYFVTFDFMRGFITAATWMRENHYIYWSNLTDLRTGQLLTF